MTRLALYQPDARSGARLSSALGNEHRLAVCESWAELERTLASGTVEGCVLDADHPAPRESLDRIKSLRRAHPELALIGFTDRDGPLDYYALGASGLDGFVSGGDGAMTTRNAVEAALAVHRGRATERALEPHLPAPAPEVVGWGVIHAGSAATTEDLAAALGTSLRALRERLRERNLPPPATLLVWGRLVAAAARLHRDGGTVEDAAFALGYAAAPSLARAIRNRTGATPGELAEVGPDLVLRGLVGEVTGIPVQVRLHPGGDNARTSEDRS
ncbi:MAG: helix-turn-helix domain-containing protein [Gemmatimonadota bacterium]|nr:helix-turn-helix domain-containing protein [Gemmatimonadota bacterium]